MLRAFRPEVSRVQRYVLLCCWVAQRFSAAILDLSFRGSARELRLSAPKNLL